MATANPKSTIVLISSPTTYQDACACARQRNMFVERLFNTAGLSRFVEESNANWMCSLGQFLKANRIPGALHTLNSVILAACFACICMHVTVIVFLQTGGLRTETSIAQYISVPRFRQV